MPAIGTSFTQSWFGRNYKELITSVNGEFRLTSMDSDTPVSLGTSFDRLKDELEKLGKLDNFPDFQ